MIKIRKENRRKNFFIDKKFQSEFIVKFCMIITAATFLAGVMTYYLTRQSATVAFESLQVQVKSTADFILPVIIWIFLIVAFLGALVTIAVTLFTSHRIAGPLFRIKMELGRLINKDFSHPIKVRAKDQLKIVASDFEQLRKVVKNTLSDMEKDCTGLREEVLGLKDDLSEEQLAQLAQRIEALEKKLKEFRT